MLIIIIKVVTMTTVLLNEPDGYRCICKYCDNLQLWYKRMFMLT